MQQHTRVLVVHPGEVPVVTDQLHPDRSVRGAIDDVGHPHDLQTRTHGLDHAGQRVRMQPVVGARTRDADRTAPRERGDGVRRVEADETVGPDRQDGEGIVQLRDGHLVVAVADGRGDVLLPVTIACRWIDPATVLVLDVLVVRAGHRGCTRHVGEAGALVHPCGSGLAAQLRKQGHEQVRVGEGRLGVRRRRHWRGRHWRGRDWRGRDWRGRHWRRGDRWDGDRRRDGWHDVGHRDSRRRARVRHGHRHRHVRSSAPDHTDRRPVDVHDDECDHQPECAGSDNRRTPPRANRPWPRTTTQRVHDRLLTSVCDRAAAARQGRSVRSDRRRPARSDRRRDRPQPEIADTTASAVVTKWSSRSVSSSNRPSSNSFTGRRTDQNSSRSMNTIGLRVPFTDA